MFITVKWIFVDSITFSSPWEDLRSVWEGESLQLKGTKREREGEIKSLTDIIFRIFTNLPEGCCTQYSFHSLLNIPLTQGDMGGRCLEISC